MSKNIRVALAAGALMVTAAVAIVAEAQGNFAQVIRERQDLMKENERALLRVIAPMMRSENQQPWNQETAVQAATIVRDGARRIPGLFPAGSGPETGIEMYALPAIWQRKPEFDAAAQLLGERASALLALAQANDQAGFRQAWPAFFRETCVACHRPFGAPGVPGVPRT